MSLSTFILHMQVGFLCGILGHGVSTHLEVGLTSSAVTLVFSASSE